jgi:hypothetical protein
LLNDVENRKADDRRIHVEFGQKRRAPAAGGVLAPGGHDGTLDYRH